MRILSIDVGIKHLAFCLFKVDDATYKIAKWGVINLCNELVSKCSGVNTKKEPCARIPRYTKNNIYYCKLHAKRQTLNVPPKEYKKGYLQKAKLHELQNIHKIVGLLADRKMKKIDYLNSILHYVDEHYLDPIIIPKAKDINIATLGRNIRYQFIKLLDGIPLDRVIIENQIGPLANRMKTLQGMVMQHFIEANVPIIKEISASNKLKSFLQPKQKTTYNERKKLGIKITSEKMNLFIFSEWRDFFLSHKKKDDLADSFLQGLWYLKSVELIK